MSKKERRGEKESEDVGNRKHRNPPRGRKRTGNVFAKRRERPAPERVFP